MTLVEVADPEPYLELEHGLAAEVVLQGSCVVTTRHGATRHVDKLVLDTGLGWALMAPEAGLGMDEVDDGAMTVLHTLGGPAGCFGGSVLLRLGAHWQARVPVVINRHSPDWLLGYPVLRHFDLLLRDAPHRPTPRLIGPRSGLLPVI